MFYYLQMRYKFAICSPWMIILFGNVTISATSMSSTVIGNRRFTFVNSESLTSLIFPSVYVFITAEFLAESWRANKNLKTCIFKNKKNWCVPKISTECCKLTQSKKVCDHFDQTTILLTIVGDPTSSLAWFVYDVYTVYGQHYRGEWGT